MGTTRTRIRRPQPQTALALISGLIAFLVTVPLLGIVLEASRVDGSRAWSLVFSSHSFDIMANSLGLTILVTAFSIVLGLPLAVLTTRTDLPHRRFWTIVAALPLVVPSYIGAFAFTSAFGPHGEFGSILGVTPPRIDGFWGAVLIISLYTYPYVFLTTRASLLTMDTSLVEAARTLNLSRAQGYRRVVYPQIRPAVGAGALLVALYAISDFGTPAFMRVEVFTSSIYWEWDSFNPDFAALLSLQLVAVVAMILVIEAGLGRPEEATSGSKRGAHVRLGRWKWLAMGVIATIGFVTLVVPVAIFGAWLVRGTGGEASTLAFQWGFAFNSVYLATLAALAASLMAIPVAYNAARTETLSARVFERVTYVGFAVPGIVIGLALVVLALTYDATFVGSIYRTFPLLVFAYVVRFIPQAVGTIRSSVLQVDDQLTEAALTLNAGRVETFRRVTLPLITPGVIAGAALVFLTTMKELPATLMLRPIGMDTLVMIVWTAHEDVFYASAAIPALMLVVISGLSMLVLLSQERF